MGLEYAGGAAGWYSAALEDETWAEAGVATGEDAKDTVDGAAALAATDDDGVV